LGTYFVHTQWYVSRPKVRGRTHAEWGVAEFFPRGYYPVRELGGRAICKCTPLAAASLGSSNCDLNAQEGLERGSELVPHSHLGTGVLSIIAVHISYRAKASTQLEKEKPPGHRRPVFFDSERLKVLLRHPERHVAVERVLGCFHLYRAGRCP
jgi:hypothetical protein